MKTSHDFKPRGAQGGYIMVAAMALIAVLLGTGLAFMRWATDESDQTRHTVAAMQAYYLAQLGIIEQGVTYLKTQQAGLLPVTDIHFPGRTVEGVGRYDQVVTGPVFAQADESSNFFVERKYFVSAVGHVDVPWMENGRKTTKTVSRKAILYLQARSFADYMYLSDKEKTANGEIIRFFDGDTLWGRTHSNDTIHIMQSPVFYDIVSTSESAFGRGASYNPQFRGPDPWFNAPEVFIPTIATILRAGANSQGWFFNQEGQEYFADCRGPFVRLWNWEEGTPFDSTVAQYTDIQLNDSTCVFVDRPLQMKGIIDGALTIGCSRHIYLIDDVRYACCTGNCREIPSDCNDYLGIVSENNVIIANTPANGRNNSNGLGRPQPNQNLTSIVITGAVVALDEEDGSFTFDQQNDIGDPFQGPSPDERGYIHLNGSVTQRRRGYVHRSNHGGTGYLKDYHYDYRMLTRRPPCFFDAEDESGHALFNVIQWGQAVQSNDDIRDGRYIRYN